MTVAIVTPWFNHPELWDGYRRALNIGSPPDQLFVIDNGSDPPLEFATSRLNYNAGFNAANNHGLHAATADIIVFLNNDIAATEAGWLTTLRNAVGPSVLAGARLRTDRHANVDGTAMPYLDGWCLAGMREDLLELGGWDETLEEPAYWGDNILCLRARANGFALREADTGLRHLTGATSGDNIVARDRASVANRERYVSEARSLLTV